MSFLEELKHGDKRGLFESDNNYITYNTGILPLDYANGFWQDVIIDGERKVIPITGITGGTVVTIIGTTGTGKTTFATQVAYNIIRPFKDSVMFFIDTEKSSNRERVTKLARAPYDEDRIIIKKENTSIEDVLQQVETVCQIKQAGGKKYMYEVSGRSYDGKPMMIYIPTVFVIDSLPHFNGVDFNTEDLGSNTDGMRGAKDVTRFFTNVLDKAWKYNITFLVINHIRPKTEMNVYMPSPKGVMMLGPGEQLPRGNVAQYVSNTFFRINVKKSDAYTIEHEGFTGFKSVIQLAKSRTNQVGTTFPVAFIGDEGFDSYYTMYEYGKSLGLIKGQSPYLYFEGLEAFKFRRQDFRSKMANEPTFASAVMWKLKPYLESLLGPRKSVPTVNDVNEEITESGLVIPRFEYGTLDVPDTDPLVA